MGSLNYFKLLILIIQRMSCFSYIFTLQEFQKYCKVLVNTRSKPFVFILLEQTKF